MKIIDIVKKKPKLFAIGLSIVTAASVGTYYGVTTYVDNQPAKKVDILKNVDIDFEGVDGIGVAKYNEKEVKDNIVQQMVKANHLPEDAVYVTNQGKTFAVESSSSLSENQQEKADQISEWFENTTIKFPKKDLENGQKIVVSLKSPKDDHNPIKSSTKEVKVSGLTKTKNIKIDDYMKSFNVTFGGVSGVGQVFLDTENPYVIKEAEYRKKPTLKENGYLKNGQKITIDFSDNIFENTKEHKYVGNKKLTLTVSGLVEPDEISNWGDIKERFTNQVNKDHDANNKGERFQTKITKQSDFFISPAYFYPEVQPKSDDDFDTVEIYDTKEANTKLRTAAYIAVSRNFESQIEGGEDLEPNSWSKGWVLWLNGNKLENYKNDMVHVIHEDQQNQILPDDKEDTHFRSSPLKQYVKDFANEYSTTMKKYIRMK